jgi:hypothetical protein
MTAFNREGWRQADRRLRSGRPKDFREQALPSALPVACRSGTGSARKRTFLSDNIQLVFGMGTDALTFKAVGMSLGLRCAYQTILLDHHIAAAAWHSKQYSQRQVASVRIS